MEFRLRTTGDWAVRETEADNLRGGRNGQARHGGVVTSPSPTDYLVAYAFTLTSCVGAAFYGLMTAPAPHGYLRAVGLFFAAFAVCHGLAWIARADLRTGRLRTVLGLSIVAACVPLALSVFLGPAAADGEARLEREQQDLRRKWELAKLEAQRAEIKSYRPVSAATVAALEADVASVGRLREAECARHGPLCSAYMDEEKAKRKELATAQANKVSMQAAAELESKAATLRAELAMPMKAPGSAFRRLTGIETNLAMAALVLVVSLALALGAMVAILFAYSNGRSEGGAGAHAWPVPVGRTAFFVQAGVINLAQPANDLIDLQRSALPRPRSREGDVHAFMNECIRPAAGQQVRVRDIFRRYRRWCSEQVPPRPSVTVAEFGNTFKTISDHFGSQIVRSGSRFYARNVNLSD